MKEKLSLEEVSQEMARVSRLAKELSNRALFLNQNPTVVTYSTLVEVKLEAMEIAAILEMLESKKVVS